VSWALPQLMAWIQRIEARAGRATLFELLDLAPTADSAAITGAFHRIAGGAHPDLHRHALAPADAERLLSAYGKVAAAYDTLREPRTRERYRKELVDRGKPIMMPPVIGGSQAIPVQRPVPAAVALAGRTGTTTQSGAIGLPIAEARTRTPSSPRITVPPAPPDPVPPAPSRTTTPATARLTSPRATSAPRTTSAPRSPTAPPVPAAPPADTRPPLITPPPPATARTTTRTSAPTTAAPPSRGKIDSRPPATGVGPRAQTYFRKAQSCLAQGDLGGALFNLRLAAAADPGSALIRVALAEVEAEIQGPK
jgi:hypothetical protein